MSIFMGFAIGVLFGGFLGAMGMYHLIKETAMDRAIEISELNKVIDRKVEEDEELEDPFEAEELPMPEEVKNGNL